MDYFALYDNQKIIKPKKTVLSEKEYAKICLECPFKDCHPSNCTRIKKYKKIRSKEDER